MRDRQNSCAALYSAHQAGHVRAAGDGAVFKDQRERAEQRGQSRTGAQDRERVDGAAEERWRSAAEEGPEDCGGGAFGGSDEGDAGELQRAAYAYGVDPGGNQKGVSERLGNLRGRNAVSWARCVAGAGFCAERGWKAGDQGELLEARHEQYQ